MYREARISGFWFMSGLDARSREDIEKNVEKRSCGAGVELDTIIH